MKWKFWYNTREDSFGITFDGMAFKGKSEYGVRFTIQIGGDFLTIQTEPSRTGYTLADGFSSVIKGVLGDPRFGPHAPPFGMTYTPGAVLTTNWALPDDKREEVFRAVAQFLKGR